MVFVLLEEEKVAESRCLVCFVRLFFLISRSFFAEKSRQNCFILMFDKDESTRRVSLVLYFSTFANKRTIKEWGWQKLKNKLLFGISQWYGFVGTGLFCILPDVFLVFYAERRENKNKYFYIARMVSDGNFSFDRDFY